MKTLAKIAALALLFTLAACSANNPEADPEPSPTPEGKSKPEIPKPDGDPPKELVIEDIDEGTGAEAEEGATVTIQYVGVSWTTGEEFDSSWESPTPATFPLGNLIQGWQQGIPGMKEGGRRRLVIPPISLTATRRRQGSPPAKPWSS